MSTKMMTQEMLTQYFEELGLKVIDHREEFNQHFHPNDLMKKGVSMSVMFDEGTRLSIQGGGANYSEPRATAAAYSSLEIAVIQNGSFVRLNEDDEDVLGWVELERIVEIAKRFYKPVTNPLHLPTRQKAPWDLGD